MFTRKTSVRSPWRPRMLAACLLATTVCFTGTEARAHHNSVKLRAHFDFLLSMTKHVPKNPDDYYDPHGNFLLDKYLNDLKHHPEWFDEVSYVWWLVQLLMEANSSNADNGNDADSSEGGGGPSSRDLWSDADVDLNIAAATPEEPAIPLLPPVVDFQPSNTADSIVPTDPVRFGQFGGGFGPVRPGPTAITGGR